MPTETVTHLPIFHNLLYFHQRVNKTFETMSKEQWPTALAAFTITCTYLYIIIPRKGISNVKSDHQIRASHLLNVTFQKQLTQKLF